MTELNDRTCITCEHWYFDGGERGYSRRTPGENWKTRCEKGHWEGDGYDEYRETYRMKLLTAKQCEDYVEVKP